MAETINNSIWREIVFEKWRNPEVHGDGPHAVVNRCKETTRVYLFSTYIEAASFQNEFCDTNVCWKRHSYGSLIPLLPPKPRPFRNQGLFERE